MTHTHKVRHDERCVCVCSPDVLCWVPPLRGQLSALRVIYWRVEDRDTHIPVLKDTHTIHLKADHYVLQGTAKSIRNKAAQYFVNTIRCYFCWGPPPRLSVNSTYSMDSKHCITERN